MASIRRASMYAQSFAKAVRDDSTVYLVIALYVFCALAFVWTRGLSSELIEEYTLIWCVKNLVGLPILVLVYGICRIILRFEERRRTAFAVMFSPARMGRFLAGSVLVMAMLPFQAMFTAVKNAMSAREFPYDRLHAEIDRVLHFGVDPFHYLFSFLKHDWLLRVVEINYNALWFGFVYTTLFWVATSPLAHGIRVRYVVSYMLTWGIVGNVFAALYLSAGPIFYGLVTGDVARFGEQVVFLTGAQGQFASTLGTASSLWGMHVEGINGFASGISAFPSVHVAVTCLNMFFAFEFSKRLGAIAAAYLAIILASSVYLGWHYAIDGYFAIALVAGIYFGVKFVMRTRWRLASGRSVEALEY